MDKKAEQQATQILNVAGAVARKLLLRLLFGAVMMVVLIAALIKGGWLAFLIAAIAAGVLARKLF